MHELALTRSIIETCSARARGARVRRVTLEVGELTCVLPQALRFCYEACTADTPLAGSELTIIPVPGRARCGRCGAAVILHDLLDACPCGAVELEARQGGDQLIIRSMEII